MVAATYGLLCSLIAPVKSGEKSYTDIVDVLQGHFSPKPVVVVERFRFHKQNQQKGESVTHYIAVIKKLLEHCKFGTRMQDALRDRLICGLSTKEIQKRLPTEVALTFQKAVEIAVLIEIVA